MLVREDGRLAYSPALDGVRAMAVAAVIAFHAELGPLRGGFLGVSVFFTLSGYLIATLLLAEQCTTGTIGLGSFYARRARRLLPAAWVTIALVVLATPWWSAGQRADLRGEAAAALAQIYNWKVAFAPDTYANIFTGEPSPLAHFWSLAIEEQFYLAIPALMVLALGRTISRRRRVVTAVGAALLTAGSGLASWLIDDPDVVYNATFTRAGELLAGVLLALAVEHRSIPARIADVVGAAGLVALTALCLTATLSSTWVYDGGLLGVAAASSALVIGAHHGERLPRLLGVPALAAVGRVSYGLYLFHWPVFVLLTPARTGVDGVALVACRLTVTGAMTIASYHLLEVPVRRSRRSERSLLPLAAAVPALALVAMIAGGARAPSSNDVLAASAASPGAAVRFDAAVPRQDPATSAAPTVPASRPSTAPADEPSAHPTRVVVVGGDRRAAVALAPLAPDVEVLDRTTPGCPISPAAGCDRFDVAGLATYGATVAVLSVSSADIATADHSTAADLDSVATLRALTEASVSELAAELRDSGHAVVVWNPTADAGLRASLSKLHLRDRAFTGVATTATELRDAVDDLISVAISERPAPGRDRARVLVLGDSTSLPFATALYDDGRRFDVLWAGEHGCPTVEVTALRAGSDSGPPSPRACRGIAALAAAAMSDFTPDVVIVVAGPAELVEQTYIDGDAPATAGDPAFGVAHDDEMAELALVVPAPIAVATSPPVEVGAFSTVEMTRSDRLAGWNAQVERWAAHHGQVHVLRYGEALTAHEAAHGTIRPDGSHPTVEGLRPIIDETVVPVITQLLESGAVATRSSVGP